MSRDRGLHLSGSRVVRVREELEQETRAAAADPQRQKT